MTTKDIIGFVVVIAAVVVAMLLYDKVVKPAVV